MNWCLLGCWFLVLLWPQIKGQRASAEHPVGIVENYSVNLTNTGPIILGSFIQFSAVLFMEENLKVHDSKKFMYEWRDTRHELTVQHANFTTSLKRCYLFEEPGQYQMRVDVFDLKRNHLTNQSQKFDITETLNGGVSSNQTLEYHRPGAQNVFSTDKPLKWSLNLTDVFFNKPLFTYKWCVMLPSNKTECVSTTNSNYSQTYNQRGKYHLTVSTVTVGDVQYCDGLYAEKNLTGVFSTSLTLKDPLSNTEVVGKRKVLTNETVSVTVHFKGSPPFTGCWELEPVLTEVSTGNQSVTCQDIVPGPSTNRSEEKESSNFTITLIPTPPAGSYILHVNVTNDVSQRLLSHKLDVTQATTPLPYHSSFIVVGSVIGCLLVVTIVLVVVIQYYHSRSGTNGTETADFNFHSTLDQALKPEEKTPFFKKLYRRVFKGNNSEQLARSMSATAGREGYGSMYRNV